MPASTGSDTLDQMLNGGYPEERAVVITGTPGTGKSTLAMQFLQAGLAEGESCLFLSSEQDVDSLREGFASFEFDLDHESLRIVSFQTGNTTGTEDSSLLSVIDDQGNVVEMDAFTEDRVRIELDRYGPFDRVVVDSVSGLEVMLEEDGESRRKETLDLIKILTDDFDATTVLTAEYVGAASQAGEVEMVATEDVVQYTVDGVVRVWRERRRGELRRFVDVMKMRGVDHDTRQHELMFADEGVEVVPRFRTFPEKVVEQNRLPTGIDGLDGLLGGGLPMGESTLLEHDGVANINELVLLAGTNAFDHGMTLVLIPRANVAIRQVDSFLEDTDVGFDGADEMLNAGALRVIDPLNAWPEHRNVYKPEATETDLKNTLQEIDGAVEDRGLFLALNTEIKAHTMPHREVRRFRYWVAAQFIDDEDLLVDIHNPDIMDPQLAELYSDAASMGVETWVDESGLQYVRLKKATAGEIGSVRLVTFNPTEPYVEVR